jgi:hypothetical protein
MGGLATVDYMDLPAGRQFYYQKEAPVDQQFSAPKEHGKHRRIRYPQYLANHPASEPGRNDSRTLSAPGVVELGRSRTLVEPSRHPTPQAKSASGRIGFRMGVWRLDGLVVR